MTSEDFKLLIPIIRKIVPTIIAQDIVNVQPMLQERKMSTGCNEEQEYSYWAMPVGYSIKDYADIDTWLTATMGEGGWGNKQSRWIGSNSRYWFRKESDRTMFILKWS
jgi:hypothetical protein